MCSLRVKTTQDSVKVFIATTFGWAIGMAIVGPNAILSLKNIKTTEFGTTSNY